MTKSDLNWFWKDPHDYETDYIVGTLTDNDLIQTNALVEIAKCLHGIMQQLAEMNRYLPPEE